MCFSDYRVWIEKAKREKWIRNKKSKHVSFIIIIIIIIIIVVVSCHRLSFWYFSWTSGKPQRSGFKFHTAALSVLCVMFQE
jgi:flagellar basal body-associated protein FliL